MNKERLFTWSFTRSTCVMTTIICWLSWFCKENRKHFAQYLKKSMKENWSPMLKR